MSCGDCDWGCTMPGCGKRMAFCAEHYARLQDRIEEIEDALLAIEHDVITAEDPKDMYDAVIERVEAVLGKPPREPTASASKTSGKIEPAFDESTVRSSETTTPARGPEKAGTLTNEEMLAMDPRAQALLLGAVYFEVPCPSEPMRCAHCGAEDQPLARFGEVLKCCAIKACVDRYNDRMVALREEKRRTNEAERWTCYHEPQCASHDAHRKLSYEQAQSAKVAKRCSLHHLYFNPSCEACRELNEEPRTPEASPEDWVKAFLDRRLDPQTPLRGLCEDIAITAYRAGRGSCSDNPRSAELEALIRALGKCRVCKGDGEYLPSCSRCNDSTDDHDCPGPAPCTTCAQTGLHADARIALSLLPRSETPSPPSDDADLIDLVLKFFDVQEDLLQTFYGPEAMRSIPKAWVDAYKAMVKRAQDLCESPPMGEKGTEQKP